MAHHKRKRPKGQRAGCTCKFWKHKLVSKQECIKASERRKLQDDGDGT
jgi:hypothetical protein